MEKKIQLISVAPPFLGELSSEAWDWWRRILEFRRREFSADFSEHEWLFGSDTHAWHCAVAIDGAVIASGRVVDPRGYDRFGTAHSILPYLSRDLRDQLFLGQVWGEAGQLIVDRRFRLNRWAIVNRVRDKALALSMISAFRANVGPVVALARDEINTDKCLKWVGFEPFGQKVHYRTGTQSTLLAFKEPSRAALLFVREHLGDFENLIQFGPDRPWEWKNWTDLHVRKSDPKLEHENPTNHLQLKGV